MPKIAITNNAERMHQIQLPSSAPGTVVHGKVLHLKPGVNMVDAADWEGAKKQHMTQVYMRELIKPSAAPEQNPERVGAYVLVEGRAYPDENQTSKLTPAEVDALVVETLDANLLKGWLQEEKRPAVRKVIEAQIAKVSRPVDAPAKAARPAKPDLE